MPTVLRKDLDFKYMLEWSRSGGNNMYSMFFTDWENNILQRKPRGEILLQ